MWSSSGNESASNIVGKFTGHGRMAFYETKFPVSDARQHPNKVSTQVRHLREDSILFGPEPLHHLLSSSHDVFCILQANRVGENKSTDYTADYGYNIVDADPSTLTLVHISKAYRTFLRDCTIELENYIGENAEEVQKLSALFYGIELIFHLAEIINLHQDHSPLVSKLQQWVTDHFPETEELADSVMRQRDGEHPTENNPNFWPAVNGLVMIGRCKEAKNLLNLHSNKDAAPIKTLRQLLLSKPDIESSGASAMINFGVQWDSWRREVKKQIMSGVFVIDQNCLQLAELLAGDNNALRMIYEKTDVWYKYLVTYITYWEPSVLAYQLGDHARTSMQLYEADRAMDKILLAIFESDLYQVIEHLQEYAESGWASLHLTDLLHHAGLLSDLGSQDQMAGEKLREDLIVQFGCLLSTNDNLWQMGLSYLDFSQTHGLAHIQQILSTRDPEVGGDVDVLLQEARKRNLVRTEQSICTVMSRRAVKQKQLGDALMWAVKADNHGLASSISELVLREMAKNENFTVANVLSDLSSCIACSEYLAFLVKYNEFLMKNTGDTQREAVFILIDLVNSGISPPYFMPVLLKKAILAARDMEGELTSSDLCSLLGTLEEIVITAQISSNKDSKEALAALKESEMEIRNVLAHCICKAEITELGLK